MICDVSLHSRQKLSMAIVFLAKIIRIGMKKFRPKNRVYGGPRIRGVANLDVQSGLKCTFTA